MSPTKAVSLLALSWLAFAATTGSAQGTTAQPGAYFISEFQVTDATGLQPYREAVESTLKPYGGRFVVRGGTPESLEGAPPQRVTMIAFPSIRDAQAWYRSNEYQAILPIRHRSAKSRVFILPALSN